MKPLKDIVRTINISNGELDEYQKKHEVLSYYNQKHQEIDQTKDEPYFNLIPNYRFNRTTAKIMRAIEALGLQEKQEQGVKEMIKDIMYSLTEDTECISEKVLAEMTDDGLILPIYY